MPLGRLFYLRKGSISLPIKNIHLVRFFRHRDRVLVGSIENDGCDCNSLRKFVLYIHMTGLWRTCSCAATILHTGVTRSAAAMRLRALTRASRVARAVHAR